ncbi:MAG: hypothetical protein ACXVCY_06570 [Pseudobdellovibrionaceae bacterium]
MKKFWCLLIALSLSLQSVSVLAETDNNSGTEPTAPTVSFANSLFKSAAFNRMIPRNRKDLKDDSAFFCKDSTEDVSSFDPNLLLSRYLYFFKGGNSANTNLNIEICAIYYRERYARTLFEGNNIHGKQFTSAKEFENQYLTQLDVLKNILRGDGYVLNNQKVTSSKLDRKAVQELVSVVQEYWLTRFITFAYLERSRQFAINEVGGVALTLGSVAGLVYFAAPRWADYAMKVPRLILNLGLSARSALIMNSVGAGLGASFATASGMPDKYEVEVWPSPLTALNLPKDPVTIETENVEKNMLLKEAYGVGGTVLGGYVSWHMVEKATETRFVQLLLEGVKRSGGFTKQVFFEAISALDAASTAEKAIIVMNAIRNSETAAFLANGYKALHGTATIGSMIITDVAFEYVKEWVRERSAKELHQDFLMKQEIFKEVMKQFKNDPNNAELSNKVFAAAQVMFESMRLLVSGLLIPAYEAVVQFSESYRIEQKVPMICNIAKMNVGVTNEKEVQKFLDSLQIEQHDNYMLAANSIDQFEATINETELYFFTNFFKRKLSLLKVSFFFDPKFGLATKQLSVSQNLKEFGKGYIRVLQGELAVNLQRIGNRLREGIEAAKKDLGNSSSDQVLNYLADRDYINASLYDQCKKLERKYPAKNPFSESSSLAMPQ